MLLYTRFTEIGGPSFYVSFLGQESLNGPLRINATYDRLLDWSEAEPELAFWDIGTCSKVKLCSDIFVDIFNGMKCSV